MFREMGKRSELERSQRYARRRSERSVRAFSVISAASVPQAMAKQPLKTRPVAKRGALQLKVDVPLMLAVLTLLIFGLVMVYSASYDYSYNYYHNPSTIFYRQIIWLVLGLCVAGAMTFMDYHLWRRLAVPVMAATILMLLGVLVVNEIRNGAVRTLIGGSVQPSELAKLMIIIYLSVWLDAKRDKLNNMNFGLLPLAAILGVMGGLILIQPDLSAVVTIFMLGCLMFFLAGGDIRQIVIMMVVAVLVGWAVVQLSPTGSDRIRDYIAGWKDPSQGSYHVVRAFEAFVRGGWLGVGIGHSQTKLTGLPVPPTDSIFAVVGEETGVLGCAGLVALFVLVLWRGLEVARRAPDKMGTYLAAGCCIWICLEAFINMAVMLNLVPFACNALPFISAGGTNLNVTMAAIGIIMNIARSSERNKEAGRLIDAVIDLRRRDGRRSIPSPRRAASPGK